MAKDKYYKEGSIISETPREFTRRVPATYLGSARYTTNLVKEVFANSIDEVAIGHGDTINIKIDTDKNIYSVEDFGQGFPINAEKDKDGKTVLQRSFDTLNTSGKTSKDGVYSGTSLGLNGIGAKLTNWLSKKLHVISYNRDNEYEELFFKDGLFEKRNVGKKKHASGTLVTWSPDEQFFKENKPDVEALKSHFDEVSALLPQLTVNFEYNGKEFTYHTPGGLNSLMDRKVDGKELFNERFTTERTAGDDTINICLTYTSDYSDDIIAYVNLGKTDSGAHLSALKTAFTRVINKYAQDNNILKKSEKNLSGVEISEGLTIICNITTTSAKYDAQSKTRIDDIDVNVINQVMSGDFATWLESHPTEAKTIVERAVNARRAREAAQKAKEKIREAGNVKKKSIFADLPSKLSDAYPKNKNDRSSCELYICLKGDTKIKLLNGTNPTIESLVGQTDLWAYSVDETGAMIPGKIKEVFKTQDVNRTLKITLSDGSFVECTPEHKFLDRDTCTWVKAKELSIGQSLFSVKTKIGDAINTEGRPMVWIPMTYSKYNSKNKKVQGHWEAVHKRVADYLGISYSSAVPMDIHHKDLNKLNNDPNNLIYITKKEHLAIHNRINHDSGRMKYENKHFTDESRKRMQTSVYRRSKEGIDRQRKAVSSAWADGKYTNATWNNYNTSTRFNNGVDNTQRNKYIKRAKAIIESGLEVNESNWNNYPGIKFINWDNLFKNNYFKSIDELVEEANNYNLSVISIEEVYYDKTIPVYCLNIDNDFHAFVLENGLITHNCEGDSASSSVNAVKDSSFQATFPIRGKILNCQKATPDKVYANSEISNITKALGLDIDKNSGKLEYNPKKLRYNKIIIATDEDVDGYAIASLLITVFNWLCPELIINGHIHRVHGALFKATFKDNTYKLFQTEQEYQAWKEKNTKPYELSRAKGLGELTNDETYEQLVNPETRNLDRLTVESVEEFEKYLEIFQGAAVEPRKDYLEEHFNDYEE